MDGSEPIDNGADILDSRDIIARIEYLEAERDGWAEQHSAPDDDGYVAVWEDEYPEERDELAALQALASEAEGCAADWTYGEVLVRDSYFEDYARELAEDIGAIPEDSRWPCTCIDWEQAARELQMDYTAVEFDGVTYWTR